MRDTAACRRATIFDAFDKALGAPPDMPAGATVIKADYRIPFLPHATMEPMACTVKVDRRSRRGVGRHAGSAELAQHRGEGAGHQSRAGAVHEPGARRRLRRKLPGYHDFVDMTARIAKVMSPAPVKMIWSRETDMQHGFYRPAAMARFAGALDAAARRSPRRVLRRRRRRRIDVHAVRDRREEGEGARRQASRAHRSVALGAQFAARLLQGSVHRRDGARREEGSVRVPPRLDDRSAAFQGGARERRGDGQLGLPAAGGEGRGIAITESFGTIVGEVAHVAVSPTAAAGESTRMPPWTAATSSIPTRRRRRSKAASCSALRRRGSARSRLPKAEGRREQLPRLQPSPRRAR